MAAAGDNLTEWYDAANTVFSAFNRLDALVPLPVQWRPD